MMRGKSFWIPAVLVLLVFGCGGGEDNPAGPGDGDTEETLKIVSIFPADGSVQVGEQVEIMIQFDRPVEQVGAIMVPDLKWMDEDWLLRSEDGTTFSRTVALEEEMVYQMIVFGAVGTDSTYLSEATMIAFTTSDVLPEGAISGTVETPNSYSAEGTVLLLVDATHWLPEYGFGGNSPEDYLVAFGFVSDGTGAYRISHVRAGNYYLYAFKDSGADGVVEEGKDLFGFYDITGLSGLIPIRVYAGAETTDIDFPVLQGSSFFD
ncbi:MAG: hypothetical protein ABIK65_00800 [Candidatus Eisenbacteria bacterium]